MTLLRFAVVVVIGKGPRTTVSIHGCRTRNDQNGAGGRRRGQALVVVVTVRNNTRGNYVGRGDGDRGSTGAEVLPIGIVVAGWGALETIVVPAEIRIVLALVPVCILYN